MTAVNMTMENDNVNNFAKDVAVELELDVKDLTTELELESNRNWDSMGLVAVMGLIEEHFQSVPDYGDIADCKTFGDILTLVKH